MSAGCRAGAKVPRSRRSSTSSREPAATDRMPCRSRSAWRCSTTTARCGVRSRCRSSSTSSCAGSSRWPRRQPELRERQPWKAAYERDYGWLGALMAEHYAGDDTQRAGSWPRASWPPTRGSASRTSRRSPTRSCAPRSIRRSVAAISSAPTRRWSSCSATWRRTGSRTTSPRAAVATSCGRSARRCTASRASG